MTRRVLALDFDGVIHDYPKAGVLGQPTPGAIDRLYEYVKRYDVFVYTNRAQTNEGRAEVRRWLRMHGAPSLDIVPKYFYDMLIDDKVLRFNGELPTPDNLEPWWTPWNR